MLCSAALWLIWILLCVKRKLTQEKTLTDQFTHSSDSDQSKGALGMKIAANCSVFVLFCYI